MADRDYTERRTEDHWHLDKRVPVALIFTILSQTFIFGWFLSNHESRLLTLEKDHASVTHLVESMEQKLESVTRDSTETKIHLQYQVNSLKEIEKILKEDVEWVPQGKNK